MKYLKGFVLGLAIVVGVQFVFADWTDPSATPPGNNTDTPLNVGLNQQDKLGSLFINTDTSNPYAIGLGVFGKSVFNGTVTIDDGTAQPGYVLVATDANGDAKWEPMQSTNSTTTVTNTTTNTACDNGVVTLSGSGSWAVPSGITKLCVTLVGAGGGGGGEYAAYNGPNLYVNGGGGGGSGSYAQPADFTVTPGQSITYSVGTGGAGGVFGTANTASNNGGATTFDGVSADGGQAASAYPSSSGGQGGTMQNNQTPSAGTASYSANPGIAGGSPCIYEGSSGNGNGTGANGYGTGGNAHGANGYGGGAPGGTNNGTGWGAGGGGACMAAAGTYVGGKGSDGTIVVQY